VYVVRRQQTSVITLVAVLAAVGCAYAGTDTTTGTGVGTDAGTDTSAGTSPDAALIEVEPVFLTLAGELSEPDAEISGMVWFEDKLVLVPQHPERLAKDGRLHFYWIERAEILARLDGDVTDPITPESIELEARGLPQLLAGFDGLEAVAVSGDRIYVTIEAAQDSGSVGYLVEGRVVGDVESVRLDLTRMVRIPSPVHLPNMSVESLVLVGDRLLALHEANGAYVNPDPRACMFDLDLNFIEAIPAPQVEYRVTDATNVDEEGRFWVINYFFPPEAVVLAPAPDAEVCRYGQGRTHADCPAVERLLEFRFCGDRVERTDTAPLLLRLRADHVCRNWEAVVRLDDRGFLLMTDRYPQTLLAFVPRPD